MRFTIMLAVLLTIGPAFAGEPRRNAQLGQQKGLDKLPKPECMCRLRNGTRVPLGTRTCLNVDDREFLAECRMASNVTIWREVQEGCPVG